MAAKFGVASALYRLEKYDDALETLEDITKQVDNLAKKVLEEEGEEVFKNSQNELENIRQRIAIAQSENYAGKRDFDKAVEIIVDRKNATESLQSKRELYFHLLRFLGQLGAYEDGKMKNERSE